MEKLKRKFAHRDRVSANSPVYDTLSPPQGHSESSTQPSNEATSSPARSEAVGVGGGEASNTEHDHPWGLKLLYEGVDPTTDIVAIHGLNGHRDKTWTFEGKGKSGDVLWLRDLLPSIIPNARIWTWGYDSRTRSKSHGEQLTIKSLYDHGRELVFDLDGERRATNSHQRPIIFIVHSLGGIVVKSALLHSDRVREGNLEEQRSIKLSTYGIIFMGTPHQGGQGVSAGKVLLNIAKAQSHTTDNLLKHLEVHSELLQQQLSEFTSIGQEFEIFFAYETKPTPIVGGVAMLIVPKWSAVVPGTPDAAEFGISEDHRRMTKFSNAENADFRKIVRILTSMMKNAGAKVEGNWSVELLRKQAISGAKAFEVPFNIRGVPIVNKYVERDREMSVIENSLHPGVANTQRRIVVLHGLGGTGKTQLSLAYARKHRDDHTAIFWLNGKTHDSLKQSIATVARSLPANQLPDSARKRLQQGSEELGEVIDEVLEWFGKPGNTQWLLLYDNIDRDASDEGQDPEAYDIRRYFPKTDRGSIIITTRRLQLRHLGEELKVNTMTTEEGIDLMRNTLGEFQADTFSATTLVNRLGALPLALAQAAAYIRETNCSISKYLLSYDTAWKALMENESHPDFSPREYDYRSVYTTWDVSFECVKQKNEDAAKMLQLWSYLDNKDIWYSLFNNERNWYLDRWYSLPQWFESVMGKEVDFREAVRILLAYSLIEAKEDSDAFAMHPVVHDWCRETLEDGSRHEFIRLAVTIVGLAVPRRDERDYWAVELRLFPHATQCVALLDLFSTESLREDDLRDFTEAIVWVGHLFKEQMKFSEAEAMFQWALESDKKLCEGDADQDTEITPRVHNFLGGLYLDQEKLDIAEAMFQRALTGFEESSGSDTEDTMGVVHNLALVYKRQGKLAEAEAMVKRVLAWRTDTLGSDHVDTVGSLARLGLISQDRGNFTEAESSLKRALAVQENKLGPVHPTTLVTIYEVGECHFKQEKFVQAEIHFKRALSGCEKTLGSDHQKTLTTCHFLGNALFAQEKFAEAEAQLERALLGCEKTLGSEHTDTLGASYSLGRTLSVRGKSVEAEVQFERALSGFKNIKDYEWTKRVAAELSRTYVKQERLAEAEALWQLLLIEFEAALGPEHVLTVDVCFEIGWLLAEEDNEAKLLEAATMYQRALSGYKEIKNYKWTRDAATQLSTIYQKQGRLAEAQALWQLLLAECEATLGPNHISTLDVYFEMGKLLKHQDDETKLADAETMFQRASSGYRKVLGLDHEVTLSTLCHLVLVLKHLGKLQEAEEMLQQALLGHKNVHGLDHEYTMAAQYELGYILSRLGKLHEAEEMFEQALLGDKKIKGQDHQYTKDTARRLSKLYEKQGGREEAKALYNQYHDTTDSKR